MGSKLLDFIKTGRLADLALGASVEQIQAICGIAEQRSEPGVVTEFEILKYGALQLTVADGSLKAITISCIEGKLPDALAFIGIPDSGLSIYDLLNQLDEGDVGWAIDDRQSFDRQLTLRSEGNVRIRFDLDRRELHSFDVQQV